MKKLLIATLLGLAAAGAQVQAKTLLVYYSFTGNIEKAADAVKDQTPTDVLRIQPAQKGLNYAANNYSLGSDLVDQIRSKPNDAFSYPAIDPVNVDFSKYDTVIIGTPLWWSNMAAPMQTFLFHNGKAMAGKKIGLIVSSASSGISGVERDAKRLIPEGNFTKSLWIRSYQVSSAPKMVSEWLKANDLAVSTGKVLNDDGFRNVLLGFGSKKTSTCVCAGTGFVSNDNVDVTGRFPCHNCHRQGHSNCKSCEYFFHFKYPPKDGDFFTAEPRSHLQDHLSDK